MNYDRIKCPFEKVILSTRSGCSMSARYYVGERTGVYCQREEARRDCIDLVKNLRDNARFALKVTDTTDSLPFGKEMKILFGGLEGLRAALDPGAELGGGIADIHALVEQAKVQFDGLRALPYPQLVKAIAAYRSPRRGH